MKIIFIRHSETERDYVNSSLLWNLSENGVALAKKLSKVDEIKSLKIVYTSFQKKAMQTALILAEDNSMNVIPDNRFTELTSITNGYIEDFDNTIKEFYARKFDRINDGETIEECMIRINEAVADIVQKNSNQDTIGIVSHGNILAIYLSQFIREDILKLHNRIKMPDYLIMDYKTKEILTDFGTKYD